ncbi:YlaI family protein [Terrilactibacillus laevilacticus]|uniref:YlaI family protein n=1 Tax=Terrilactibacillus laevilacticus TaxID=1380157 RepID=A0ABW5PQ94_9BACI|nr:YlaI family protein [Terrilactibacillus laevilacticus]
MLVKCIICEKKVMLDDDSPLAKRLRNRPIHTYTCDECYKRIGERTRERWATGKFTLHLPSLNKKSN